jgi:glycosyltransferase involved in cell wall biosynthesis
MPPSKNNMTNSINFSDHILRVSIVVPVFQGELTLDDLIEEIVPLTAPSMTPANNRFQVIEVILVNDGALDGSSDVILGLAKRYPFVRPIWLSRNFGQHPATLAGMVSTVGDWIVTLDEDGQHNPAFVGPMLDQALEHGAQLVYPIPENDAPHAWWRNLASKFANSLGRKLLGDRSEGGFSSFRLIQGEIARSLAAFCGPGVFLDIALSWVVGRVSFCHIVLRNERGRSSGYSLRKLMAHLWRLIMTAGTLPLRIIALMGCLTILISIVITIYLLWGKYAHQVPIQGWTSLMIAISLFSGLILFSIGVIAEYLGVLLIMALGKPLYLTVTGPKPKDKDVS